MSFQLRICEPSGENRSIPLQGAITLGKGNHCHVILRDPTLPSEAATLSPIFLNAKAPNTPPPHTRERYSPFWVKVPDHSPPAHLGDLLVREAHIPTGIPFKIGETRLSIEPEAPSQILPPFPSGVRPWWTHSESGREILWLAKKAASTSLSTYLGGETGTGKEVLANLIHAWSPRKAAPFVPIHCGALPLSLAESELFGHVKGAFTGAVGHRPGALMQAHGGTLFLDEVGDLPLDIQVKLLRFLENGEIRPVGADRSCRADVRIICATHHPLPKLVESGRFRRDLFYRLASITLPIPSLRSRPEDIEMLADRFSKELDRTLSPRALLRLRAHTWPGNVRELRHAIERASGLSDPFTRTLREEAFDFLLTPENILESPDLELGASVLSLHEMERVALLKALKLSHGHRSKAAKILGVARSTLFEMLKRHQIQGPRASGFSQPATKPFSK